MAASGLCREWAREVVRQEPPTARSNGSPGPAKTDLPDFVDHDLGSPYLKASRPVYTIGFTRTITPGPDPRPLRRAVTAQPRSMATDVN